MTDLQLRFVEEAARLLQQQVAPEVGVQLEQLVAELKLLSAPPAPAEFTLAELTSADRVEIHPELAGPWRGERAAWQEILTEARRLGDSLTLTAGSADGLVRLIVNSFQPVSSVAALGLKFQVERLGGRLFTTEQALAITLPLSRPEGYVPSRTAAPEAPAPEPAPAVTALVPELPTTQPVKASVRARRLLDELAARGDWTAVARAAEELLAAAPGCQHALQHLALAHVRRQDWTSAFPVLRRLVASYFAAEELEPARALLRQMLTELPDPQTGLQLAEDCLVQGELGLAESYFQAAADQLVRRQDLRGAVSALRRLQLVRPGDLGVAQSIGTLLVRLGEHQQAVAVFRTILRVRPSHRGALGALDELARLTADAELAELVRRRLLRPVSRTA